LPAELLVHDAVGLHYFIENCHRCDGDYSQQQILACQPNKEKHIASSLDPHVAARFCDAVNHRLPDELQIDPTMLNRWLLNLRRRGDANSGLPRP